MNYAGICLPSRLFHLVRIQRDIAFSHPTRQPRTIRRQEILKVAGRPWRCCAREAFRVVAFHYRSSHLAKVAAILGDPEATKNDRLVALTLLRNAVVASEGRLPMCQDTGTSIIFAKKGQRVWTNAVTKSGWRGIFQTYQKENLRYSQSVPLSMYRMSTRRPTCRPRSIFRPPTARLIEFLFVAKGGGSANKSMLFQETPGPGIPAKLEDVSRSEAAFARDGRLPTVPSGDRGRRHVGRGDDEDDEAREHGLS